MIATILTFQKGTRRSDLYRRFVNETAGIVASYAFQGETEDGTITVWVSDAARNDYLASPLRTEIDAALPGASRKVYSVIDVK